MADLGKVLKQKPAKHSGKKQHAHKPHNNHELTHTRSLGKNKTGNHTSLVLKLVPEVVTTSFTN